LTDVDQSSPHDPRVGAELAGRYRVIARLAAGGIGVVYRGERLGLGRAVAIKFLHQAFSNEQGLIKRFEREAQALSRIAHPHCVSIIDYGVEEGAPYLVMDYVRGKTLRDLMDEGPIPLPRTVFILRQLLAGLDHCHQQGIVHRDVKPANIMLTEVQGTGDHAQILDFGLAKLRDGTSDLSVGSIAIGTPSYMPPEQASGDPVDARSDVYALGVMLHEMVTGRKPFEADQAFEVIAMHASKSVPSLKEHAPGVEFPSGLDALIKRAMAKAPKDRFQTAGEMLAALEKVVGRPGNGQSSAGIPIDDFAYEETKVASSASLTRPPTAPTPDRGAGKRRFLLAFGALVFGGASATFLVLNGMKHDKGAVTVAVPDAATQVVAVPPTPPPTPPALTTPDATVVRPPDAAPPDAAALPDAALPDAPLVDASIPAEELAEPVGEVAVEIVPEEQVDTPAPVALPATPQVHDVDDVRELIAAGKRDEALAGLQQLRRQNPKNAYVHYLLGNVYFERLWWSDAMESYRSAIRVNRAYRSRAIMINNVIRSLGSTKTYAKASYFLRKDVGGAAAPYLRKAAKSDKNSKVRARAALILKQLGRR
jgi:eukaryotic-like serine/threonine-protein kinase